MPKDSKTKTTHKKEFRASNVYGPAVILIMVAVIGVVFALIGYIAAMSTITKERSDLQLLHTKYKMKMLQEQKETYRPEATSSSEGTDMMYQYQNQERKW